uniref:Uncharacterized protein n=1 Tax=Rhizophora mucronata TaxID=61149 RepID=A0A2P2PZJ7_RHIMU
MIIKSCHISYKQRQKGSQ